MTISITTEEAEKHAAACLRWSLGFIEHANKAIEDSRGIDMWSPTPKPRPADVVRDALEKYKKDHPFPRFLPAV